ncbi:MAG TPA: LacI family DNA-binding transcriptional regulator [Phycisphaerae bacterium]|nr:LacI family DNA-binding transcriptional regulator [Phycisphaerae bacterium]
MPPTIVELGRLAGCSPATVSRALNNSGSVSDKTRKAIVQALRQTQYMSKRSARKMRRSTRETGELIEVVLHYRAPYEPLSVGQGGLQVGPLTEPPEQDALAVPGRLTGNFLRQIVNGVLVELAKWGHRAAVQTSKDLLGPELLADINRIDRHGVLLLGEYTPDLRQFAAQCIHPLVLVDIIDDCKADVVTTDNLAGISQAFDHLYELGHRKIGFVGKFDPDVAFVERFTAFQWKMAEKGLPVVGEWIHEGPNHIDMTATGVRRILGLADRPTALLCVNDCAALGVLRAAGGMGIAIPDEISVVGFDDEEAASLVTPPLTTVHVPMSEIGRQAVRQLMIQIQAGKTGRSRGCRIRLMPELVVRRSTGPVKA